MDTKTLLDYLAMVSNKSLFLNFVMHLLVLLSMASIYLIKDARVRKYVLNSTLLILFLSVTLKAVIYGNPFHAVTFGTMVITEVVAMIKDKCPLHALKFNLRTFVSLFFILLGLWYPEFVKASASEYFLVSPVGAIPCPTLITALGILNLYYHSINRNQFIVIAFFGSVYGFIGTFKLGILLDLTLIGTVLFSIYNITSTRAILKKNANLCLHR